MFDCIFCKIVEGKIFLKKVYEDDDLLVFFDINLVVFVYVLVIFKQYVEFLSDCILEYVEMLGKLFGKFGEIVCEQGLIDGFCIIVNIGRVGGQEVYYLYVYIFGGLQLVGLMLVCC